MLDNVEPVEGYTEVDAVLRLVSTVMNRLSWSVYEPKSSALQTSS
jgi:hypothetical protein